MVGWAKHTRRLIRGARLLDPTRRARGPRNHRWGVIENLVSSKKLPRKLPETTMKPLQRRIQQAAREGRVNQLVVERDHAQSYVLVGEVSHVVVVIDSCGGAVILDHDGAT